MQNVKFDEVTGSLFLACGGSGDSSGNVRSTVATPPKLR